MLRRRPISYIVAGTFVVLLLTSLLYDKILYNKLIDERGGSSILENAFVKTGKVYLVTGAAGFLGMHLCVHLLSDNKTQQVIGIDNLRGESSAKNERLETVLLTKDKFRWIQGDVCDGETIFNLIGHETQIDTIVHLASQNYERNDYSVKRPFSYPLNNLDCFVEIFDALVHFREQSPKNTDIHRGIPELIYLSSGIHKEGIDSTHEERISKAFFQLYNISSLGLRLDGDVYGPWGFMPPIDPISISYYIDDVTESLVHHIDSINKSAANAKVKQLKPIRKNVTTLDKGVAFMLEWLHNRDSNIWERKIPPNNQSNIVSSIAEENKANEQDFDICLISSMFSTSVEKADEIRNISNYKYLHNKEKRLRYYFFTNLDELAVDCGWRRVVIKDFPYRRLITQSRWPKFMAWEHPLMRSCGALIYSDANLPPMDLPYKKWKALAKHALEYSPSGVYQRANKRINIKLNLTILGELDTIIKNKKDLVENIEAQKQWLVKQPDFNNTVMGYWNMILVTDPTNEYMRQLMTTFWAHYSREHQSWRDQPLYRYLVSKLHIYPLIGTGFNNYFDTHKTGKNAHNHQYSSEDNNNSAALLGKGQ